MAEKAYALLPHVAEDEIASSDDHSSDSEDSDVAVDAVRVTVPPPLSMVRLLWMNRMFIS